MRKFIKRHHDDGLRLFGGKAVFALKVDFGISLVFRSFDDLNDFVKNRLGFDQASDDRKTGFVFGKAIIASSCDDVELVLDVAIAISDKVHRTRMPIDDGHHVRGVIGLKRGLAHQISQDGFRLRIVLEVYCDPQSVSIGLIPDLIDAWDRLVMPNFVDRFYEFGFVDLVRDLANDYLSGAIFVDADFGPAGDGYAAMSCPIDVLKSFRLIDDAASREIRAWDVTNEIIDVARRMFDPVSDGLGYLFEVMRRDRGRDANGDSFAAIA